MELLGHDSSTFSFLRNLQLLSIVAVLIYIPTNNVGGFSFFVSILTPSLQQRELRVLTPGPGLRVSIVGRDISV